MDEEEEYDMRTQDTIAQTMLRNLELEWEEQKPIPHDDLLPRLMWLSAIACQATGKLERRSRLLRLMACALEWQVQDEMAAKGTASTASCGRRGTPSTAPGPRRGGS